MIKPESYILSADLVEEIKEVLLDHFFGGNEEEEWNNDDVIDLHAKLEEATCI